MPWGGHVQQVYIRLTINRRKLPVTTDCGIAAQGEVQSSSMLWPITVPIWTVTRVDADKDEFPERNTRDVEKIHIIMALRQDGAFIHIVDIDGDCCCGCWAVTATDQSHWVLSTDHEDILTLTLKVQDLRNHTVVVVVVVVGGSGDAQVFPVTSTVTMPLEKKALAFPAMSFTITESL
ncbi:hypothetical protein EYF80_009220 [Liparis tanakae]|uniref:Uncharacterized protein n=1 Tax=Liparis tanakae TaxID=230148 RepID=A0A4Z2IRK9_9TELE|nr:hypothetical protein EYF80_009220 [Liparis tanakae]